MQILAENRRAYAEYFILESYEAGIVLFGFETKAIKTGGINLAGAAVIIRNNNASLINATIAPYQAKNTPHNYDPMRARILLLHKKELKTLQGTASQKGLTVIPLRVYNKRGLIKITIAVVRHKKQRDRRAIIKKREVKREIERAFKRG